MRTYVNYARALVWVRRAAIGLALFFVTTIGGGFVLQLCADADWYKHPWATVATLLVMIQWFIGNSVVHWAACATVGFAIGIWLDDLLRRLAAKPKSPPQKAAADKGFLDHEIELHEAIVGLDKLLLRVGHKTEWVSRKMEKQVLQLQKFVAPVGTSGLTPKITLQIQTIADKSAAIFEKFTSEIVAATQNSHYLVSTIIVATEWKIANQEKSRAAASIDYLKLRSGTVEFIDSLPRGVSSNLNGAVQRTTDQLVQFIGIINVLVDFCTSSLAKPLDQIGRQETSSNSFST